MTNPVAEIWTELGISLLIIIARVASRWEAVGLRGLAPDDWLMALAGVFFTIDSTLAYLVRESWHGLANNSMTEEYRAALDPHAHEYYLRVQGSKTQFMGWIFYCCVLWTLKFCWLFFYLRLGNGVKRMKLKVYIGFALSGVSFVATQLVIVFGCFPVSKHWQIYPDPGNFCYPAVSALQVYTVITTNLLSDFYVMAIPIPMIWNSTIDLKHKISLITMFCGGIITAIFGLLRCVLILTSGADGPSQGGAWSVRESFVAVIVSNMPFIFPLIRRVKYKIKGTYGSYASQDKSKNGSVPLSTVKGPRRAGFKKVRHPNDIPDDQSVLYGSEERIVKMDKNSTVTTTTGVGSRSGSRNDIEVERGNGIQITTEWQVESHDETHGHKMPY